MEKGKFDFDAALRRIADKMEGGHLLLAMGPEAFLAAIEDRMNLRGDLIQAGNNLAGLVSATTAEYQAWERALEKREREATEDPVKLVQDFMVRLVYIGHPAEAFRPDGEPDFREIMRRGEAFIHGKPRPTGPLPECPPPAFQEPDPATSVYSHVNSRGVICAVSEDGDIFIRPDATPPELRAALIAILNDEGIPFPEKGD